MRVLRQEWSSLDALSGPLSSPKLFCEKLGFSAVSIKLSTRKWNEVKAGFEKDIEKAKGNEDETGRDSDRNEGQQRRHSLPD